MHMYMQFICKSTPHMYRTTGRVTSVCTDVCHMHSNAFARLTLNMADSNIHSYLHVKQHIYLQINARCSANIRNIVCSVTLKSASSVGAEPAEPEAISGFRRWRSFSFKAPWHSRTQLNWRFLKTEVPQKKVGLLV